MAGFVPDGAMCLDLDKAVYTRVHYNGKWWLASSFLIMRSSYQCTGMHANAKMLGWQRFSRYSIWPRSYDCTNALPSGSGL